MLKVELDKHVARVILDRPDVHNAFNDELIRRVTEAFTDLGNREEIRVIILAGNGKSFCAGADLNWMKRMVEYSHEQNVEDARAAARMFLAIAKCPKPVIARIHGAALGGGAGLAAACDIAIAVESAQFGFTEVKLGILPAVISPFVVARIGSPRAREFFITIIASMEPHQLLSSAVSSKIKRIPARISYTREWRIRLPRSLRTPSSMGTRMQSSILNIHRIRN